jgi:hypothetical protein
MDNKIAFFTTCMNRLKHLKRTLPQNIKDNEDYENCVFVVLNYNSQDDLHKWMLDNMGEQIESGQVIYYRTLEPEFFWHNHAKNMAAKCTPEDAEIICSIDSDNYTATDKEGVGLAVQLNEIFNHWIGTNIFVRAAGWEHREEAWHTDSHKYYSASGKIATRRKDFFKYRGFNEKLKGHYFDEEELWQRLEKVVGFRKITLPVEYSKFINHTNYERLINIDPGLIDRNILEKLRKENHPFTSKEFMKDEDVSGYYPNGKENQRRAEEVLKKRIRITNDKWGEGKVEKI